MCICCLRTQKWVSATHGLCTSVDSYWEPLPASPAHHGHENATSKSTLLVICHMSRSKKLHTFTGTPIYNAYFPEEDSRSLKKRRDPGLKQMKESLRINTPRCSSAWKTTMINEASLMTFTNSSVKHIVTLYYERPRMAFPRRASSFARLSTPFIFLLEIFLAHLLLYP